MQDNFFKTDPQYGKGFKVDEYNGTFSLTSCQEGQDGGIYAEWVMLQDKDRKPRVKANGQYLVIPMKVVIGKSAEEAIASLNQIIGILRGGETHSNQPTDSNHGQTYHAQDTHQRPEPPPFEDTDMPFD